MGDTVFVNGRAVVHKDSAGKSIAFPDVCLCPPGPPAGLGLVSLHGIQRTPIDFAADDVNFPARAECGAGARARSGNGSGLVQVPVLGL